MIETLRVVFQGVCRGIDESKEHGGDTELAPAAEAQAGVAAPHGRGRYDVACSHMRLDNDPY
jgi:hypothetical protein